MKNITFNKEERRIEFTSPINIDDGYRNHPQGEKKSTMIYYPGNNGGTIECLSIYWKPML